MSSPIVQHLAIIMDGNFRWAKEHNIPAREGHEKGVEVLVDLVAWVQRKKATKTLTVFAFSRENWHRPDQEIQDLMQLLGHFLDEYKHKFVSEGIRLRVVGEIEALDASLQQKITSIEQESKQGSFSLNVAVNYSGRWDIAQACNSIAKQNFPVTESSISEALLVDDVDLLIRTGFEQRLSNFMLWQLAYTEIFFSDCYWPDFNEQRLDKALDFYCQRSRRFGGR